VPRQFAHVSRSANMEWGFKETRVAVRVLHKCGKSDYQIFYLLKPLKITQNLVYRAIKRCKELWGVEDRARSGRLRCVRTKFAIKTVRERIRRNPLRKQNSFAPKAKHRSMSRLIRDDLHMRAHLLSKGHLLTPALKDIRQTRTKASPPATRRKRARKHPLHGQENLHHRGAVQPPER